ncbi:MAG: GNAT family N-acetyltransferase [Deltaproteobacteria bacterium]|nr:GNAT family N-acetyltransferase [Candidatus Zymogenaceae bacterium]
MEDSVSIDIRRMTMADYNAVIDLWRGLSGMGLSKSDEPEELERFIDRNPETSLVLTRNDIVIGSVLGGFDGRRGYLYHLAVRKEDQGLGYGTMLLKEVERRFHALGAMRLHLMIYTDNEAAEFYKKRNWWVRDELVLMSRDL